MSHKECMQRYYKKNRDKILLKQNLLRARQRALRAEMRPPRPRPEPEGDQLDAHVKDLNMQLGRAYYYDGQINWVRHCRDQGMTRQQALSFIKEEGGRDGLDLPDRFQWNAKSSRRCYKDGWVWIEYYDAPPCPIDIMAMRSVIASD